MGTFLGPKCIPYTYMDPLGLGLKEVGLEWATSANTKQGT